MFLHEPSASEASLVEAVEGREPSDAGSQTVLAAEPRRNSLRTRAPKKIVATEVEVLHIFLILSSPGVVQRPPQPCLLTHTLFRVQSYLSVKLLQELSLEEVRFVFTEPCSLCNTSYFFVWCEPTYNQTSTTSLVEKIVTVQIEEKTWMCDSGPWTEWVHVGTVKASAASQVMLTEMEGKFALVKKHRLTSEVCMDVTQFFHKCVTNAMHPAREYPTDTRAPLTEFGDLLLAMNLDLQVSIGLISLGLEPDFLQSDGTEHVHDEGVFSHSWNSHGLEMNVNRLQTRIISLMQELGTELLRYKGVLAVKERMQKFILQGVHMLFSGGFASDVMCGSDMSSGVWKDGELKHKHAGDLLIRERHKPQWQVQLLVSPLETQTLDTMLSKRHLVL